MAGKSDDADSDGTFITSLARGLSVLRAFGRDRPEMTLAQAAAATGLSPAVARRCLYTLVDLGYVAKSGRTFFLCPKVYEFCTSYAESNRLDSIAVDPLVRLRDRTGDTITFNILMGRDNLTLLYVPTRKRMTPAMHAGTIVPAHLTASGSMILACRDDAFVENYLEMVGRTYSEQEAQGVRSDLLARLHQMRTEQFASIPDSDAEGWMAVAVPITGPSGSVLASIACVATFDEGTIESHIAQRLPALRHTAVEIEVGLRLFPIVAQSLGDAPAAPGSRNAISRSAGEMIIGK